MLKSLLHCRLIFTTSTIHRVASLAIVVSEMNSWHHQPRALVHTTTQRTVAVHYSKGFGATHSGYKSNKTGTKGTAKTPQQVCLHNTMHATIGSSAQLAG